MKKETKKKIRVILWFTIFTIIFMQASGNYPDAFKWISSTIGLVLLGVLFFMRETPKRKSQK